MIQSVRIVGEERSEERRFYISSLKPQAQFLADVIRKHWGIVSLHWVLDVVFREDECRKRKNHSAENFAMLRHLTLNLLKQEKSCKRSIAGKRLLAGSDESYPEKVRLSGLNTFALQKAGMLFDMPLSRLSLWTLLKKVSI